MAFTLTPRSAARLSQVHPDLQRVVRRAAADWPRNRTRFVITEGLRSLARQQALYAAGASQTLRSRHLTGHAVDLAVVAGGQARWDWPLYDRLGERLKAAAEVEGVPLEWGGDWRSLRDGPHFQLPWERYPAEEEEPPA